MLDWTLDDGIATLAFDHGPVNALDREFLIEITETLRAIDADDVDALILTGNGPAFSAGADLKRVVEGGAGYVHSSVDALSDAFDSIFRFRRPAIAAINGHAIAGGAVFSCACDHKIMARGSGLIGLAELRVGVPFPTYALEIVRFAVAPQHFQEIILLARNYSPEEGMRMGLVDEVVEPGELMDRATRTARRLAAIPRPTFDLMKKALRRNALEAIGRYRMEVDPDVAALWAGAEVQGSIRRFIESIGL